MLKERVLKFLKLEGLANNLSAYVETRIELLKIEIKEDVARLMATVFLVLIVTFSFVLFIVLLSLGLTWYLGTLVGLVGAFMIMAGFYLLMSLVLLLFRKELNQVLEKQLLKLAQQKSKKHGTA